MKPTVTKLSSVSPTALLCCPHCTSPISYEQEKQAVVCHACGATVTAPAFGPTGPSANQE